MSKSTIGQLLTKAFAAFREGKVESALDHFSKVLKSDPRQFDALLMSGIIAFQQQRLDTARARLQAATRSSPKSAIAWYNLGVVEEALDLIADALASFERAVAIKPDYAEAHASHGHMLEILNRPADAIASLDRAIALNPRQPGALNNRASVLALLGRNAQAADDLRRAIALNPDHAPLHNNLANHFLRGNQLADALAAFERAISLSADADPKIGRASTLLELGRHGEAIEVLRDVLAQEPDNADARWSLTMAIVPPITQSDHEIEQSRIAFSRELQQLEARPIDDDSADAVGVRRPFFLAYHEADNKPLLKRYGALCASTMMAWLDRQSITTLSALPAPTNSKHQIAIVSSHVRAHSVWQALTKAMVQHLDRTRFDVHVFTVNPLSDAQTEWARSNATSFTSNIQDLKSWIAAIRARAPDVLIYPEIGMDAFTTKLAALRLAPVQLTSWGHPETSGFPNIDYYLSPAAFEPPGAQQNYTERLVCLPGLGFCYQPDKVDAAPFDLATTGLSADRPILLLPGMPHKYTPRHDRVLIDIARRLPRCQLVFFRPAIYEPLYVQFKSRLTANFLCQGLQLSDYMVEIGWLPPAQYFGLMQQAGAMLDTIGFSGVNTALQAIQCGLPIVAWEGRFMRGRLASGLLRHIGLDELVVSSDQAYVDLAVALAGDLKRRARIGEIMRSSYGQLMGDVSAIRALENFLVEASAEAKNKGA